MISPSDFSRALAELDIDFYAGVPDSLLKDLCAYLESSESIDNVHISANEGNALALCIGYHLATSRIPVCFLQNSGIGNIVNPVTSLTHKKVYSIPTLLVVGWRGEPFFEDEPQHLFQGSVTLEQLKLLDIPYLVIDASSSLHVIMDWIKDQIADPTGPFSLVVKKGTFSNCQYSPYNPFPNSITRENALKFIVSQLNDDDLVISTTGKTSRELYEVRYSLGQENSDFLTVGGMGHTSSIALGVALARSDKNVICLDGDGSLLMHMGSLAIMGAKAPPNLKYILLNNSSHESVGGQPTIASTINFGLLTSALNISSFWSCSSLKELSGLWTEFYSTNMLSFLELRISSGSRSDLGRPKLSPTQNKANFMIKTLC